MLLHFRNCRDLLDSYVVWWSLLIPEDSMIWCEYELIVQRSPYGQLVMSQTLTSSGKLFEIWNNFFAEKIFPYTGAEMLSIPDIGSRLYSLANTINVSSDILWDQVFNLVFWKTACVFFMSPQMSCSVI